MYIFCLPKVEKILCLNRSFNEGCINYFAEEISNKMGIEIAKRYEVATPLVRSVKSFIGEEFDRALFTMVFQDNLKDFFCC